MVNESRRLSTGSSVGTRIVGAVFGLILMAFGMVFAAAALFAVSFTPFRETSNCVSLDDQLFCQGWTPEELGPLEIAGLLVGAAFLLLGILAVFSSLRGTAAWLDGTRLRVRRAFSTRTVDLSIAEITGGNVTHTHTSDHGRIGVRRIPTLMARDPATGRKVTLSLRGATMDRIPPVELRALADAITTGRPESDVDACRVARQLREMAEDPLELHR